MQTTKEGDISTTATDVPTGVTDRPPQAKVKPRTIQCPHCGQPVEVAIRTEIINVRIPGTPIRAADGSNYSTKVPLKRYEQDVVELAKTTGTLDIFVRVVALTRKESQLPRNMERLFITFLRNARKKKAIQPTLKYFSRELAPARIDFYAAEGIGVVLADGEIRGFLPSALITGGQKLSSQGLMLASGNGATNFDEWFKTRFGLVAGKGAFFAAMQAKSRGDFARTMAGQ